MQNILEIVVQASKVLLPSFVLSTEVGASELVPTEHPRDCGPSEPGITAIFYPEHEVAAAELIK
jgi:hypothetical protein